MRQPVQRQMTRDELRARQQRIYHADTKEARAHFQADFKRRQRAAGIEIKPDDDDDTIRYRLARHIAMLVNNWEGCPLRLCRRMRGCMARRNRHAPIARTIRR